MRVLVKEGWADKKTGKKGEPRLQFTLIQYLQDVLPSFAKKLVLLLNINDIQTDFIQQLNQLFQENKGDNTVTFEIMELEKITKIIETTAEIAETDEEVFVEETDSEDADVPLMEAQKISTTTEVEEINVVTKLSMPSRKLKVKISNELLLELEKRQINFKLN
jgi:DNA polymerase-3 subunit alpha